jgi:hypothetical protein
MASARTGVFLAVSIGFKEGGIVPSFFNLKISLFYRIETKSRLNIFNKQKNSNKKSFQHTKHLALPR